MLKKQACCLTYAALAVKPAGSYTRRVALSCGVPLTTVSCLAECSFYEDVAFECDGLRITTIYRGYDAGHTDGV